jgi:hypothetical protein
VVYGGDIQVAEHQYLTKLGGTPLVMDVTKSDQVNAGYAAYGSIEDVPIEAIQAEFDVNVFGCARLKKRCCRICDNKNPAESLSFRRLSISSR